jgi:hypothetical protein
VSNFPFLVENTEGLRCMDRKRLLLFLERNKPANILLIAGIICIVMGLIAALNGGWKLVFWNKVKAPWIGKQDYMDLGSGVFAERRYFKVPEQQYSFNTKGGEPVKYIVKSETHEDYIWILYSPSAPYTSNARLWDMGWLFSGGMTGLLLGAGCFIALYWIYSPRYRAEIATEAAVWKIPDADTENEAAPLGKTSGARATKGNSPKVLRGSEAARASYEYVAEELMKGTLPGRVQAGLARRGFEPDTALVMVNSVLEELPGILRARHKLPYNLILLGSALLLSLVALIMTVVSFSRGLIPIYLYGAVGIYFGVIRTVVAYRKLELARRLETIGKRWVKEALPVALPAQAVSATPSQRTNKPGRNGGSGQPPVAREASPLLAREAITLLEVKQGLRLWLFSVGPILAVGVLAGCTGLMWMLINPRGSDQSSVSHQQAEEGPNAPEPNEGPQPRGWTVLFRSDDPSIWNTDSPGERFAVPVRHAHSTIRYLRLKRIDTGDMLIVPITHRQLLGEERPGNSEGHWWNGTAREDYGARHLGIVGVPAASKEERGLIGLAQDESSTYSGSGFGWKTFVDDRQYYCWQGREIPQTVFEIAVKVDALNEDERRRFTGFDPDEGPPRGWTVLFRSDDPSIWNTDSPGEKFALPVGRAHNKIHHLRLKRMDTGEMLVLPIKRAQLAIQPSPIPEKGYGWNGTAKNEYRSGHMGIFQATRIKWPDFPPDTLSVMDDGWDAFSGSGFAHKPNTIDTQHYSWRGKEIPKTVFEIAVTADRLTKEERASLLK